MASIGLCDRSMFMVTSKMPPPFTIEMSEAAGLLTERQRPPKEISRVNACITCGLLSGEVLGKYISTGNTEFKRIYFLRSEQYDFCIYYRTKISP